MLHLNICFPNLSDAKTKAGSGSELGWAMPTQMSALTTTSTYILTF